MSEISGQERHARVMAIKIGIRKGQPKEEVHQGEFLVDFGLAGDIHGGAGARQVSLLTEGPDGRVADHTIHGLCSGRFSENISTTGLLLGGLVVGTRLRVGQAILEITQVGKDCHDECLVKQRYGPCDLPQRGLFAKVVENGVAKPGDMIEIL